LYVWIELDSLVILRLLNLMEDCLLMIQWIGV